MTAKKKAAPKKRRDVTKVTKPTKTAKAKRPKQELFVAEYLANGFNATQAAIAAGYSAKTADSQASRLLKVPAVAEAIEAAKAARLEELEISGTRILREIGTVAFSHSEFMRTEQGGFIVKTKDKLKALEMLGKNQKLFTDKVEHSGSVAIAWVAELSDEELAAQLAARGVKLEGK